MNSICEKCGLAYRPIAHDRFNALSHYTIIEDQRPAVPGQSSSETSWAQVIALEWSWQLNKRLEWVDKEASKTQENRPETAASYQTQTLLSIHRLNINVWKALDLGIEYRMLKQREANDQLQGWLTELSWRANKYLRIGAGYNFTDFSDNEFSNNDYSVRGTFLRLQATY